jgi:hypothetical protein
MDARDYFLAGVESASLVINGHFLQHLKGYLHFSDRRQKTGPRASVFGERQLNLLRRSWAWHSVAVGKGHQESHEGIFLLVRQFQVAELLFIKVG